MKFVFACIKTKTNFNVFLSNFKYLYKYKIYKHYNHKKYICFIVEGADIYWTKVCKTNFVLKIHIHHYLLCVNDFNKGPYPKYQSYVSQAYCPLMSFSRN